MRTGERRPHCLLTGDCLLEKARLDLGHDRPLRQRLVVVTDGVYGRMACLAKADRDQAHQRSIKGALLAPLTLPRPSWVRRAGEVWSREAATQTTRLSRGSVDEQWHGGQGRAVCVCGAWAAGCTSMSTRGSQTDCRVWWQCAHLPPTTFASRLGPTRCCFHYLNQPCSSTYGNKVRGVETARHMAYTRTRVADHPTAAFSDWACGWKGIARAVGRGPWENSAARVRSLLFFTPSINQRQHGLVFQEGIAQGPLLGTKCAEEEDYELGPEQRAPIGTWSEY